MERRIILLFGKYSTFKFHLFAWLVFVGLPTCPTALFADTSTAGLAFCCLPPTSMTLIATRVNYFVRHRFSVGTWNWSYHMRSLLRVVTWYCHCCWHSHHRSWSITNGHSWHSLWHVTWHRLWHMSWHSLRHVTWHRLWHMARHRLLHMALHLLRISMRWLLILRITWSRDTTWWHSISWGWDLPTRIHALRRHTVTRRHLSPWRPLSLHLILWFIIF